MVAADAAVSAEIWVARCATFNVIYEFEEVGAQKRLAAGKRKAVNPFADHEINACFPVGGAHFVAAVEFAGIGRIGIPWG